MTIHPYSVVSQYQSSVPARRLANRYPLEGCDRWNAVMLASVSNLPPKVCRICHQNRGRAIESRLDVSFRISPPEAQLRWKRANGNARADARFIRKSFWRSSFTPQEGISGPILENIDYDFGSDGLIAEDLDTGTGVDNIATGFRDVEQRPHEFNTIQVESQAYCQSFSEKTTPHNVREKSNGHIGEDKNGSRSSVNNLTSQLQGEGKCTEFAEADVACHTSDDRSLSMRSTEQAFEAPHKEGLEEEVESSMDRKQVSPEPAMIQNTVIQGFNRKYVRNDGILSVQILKAEHLKATEELLVDSFLETMWGPLACKPLLSMTVKRYLHDKFRWFPNTVTLVGLYAPAEDNMILGPLVKFPLNNWLLAGTVEVSFSDAEKIAFSPSHGFPYLCNMAVGKRYRRRGIGWQLLRAAEDLAVMKGCWKMHLHCRIIDSAALQMYKKAGYKVEGTDNIWILLSFQRRRHLMVKSLDAS